MPINQTKIKHHKCLALVFSILLSGITYSQEEKPIDAVLAKFYEIGERYKDVPYGEDLYWYYYFERKDLIDKLKDHDSVKLSYYLNSGYTMRTMGLSNESIKLFKQYLVHFNTHKSKLSQWSYDYFYSKQTSAFGYLAEVYANASHLDSAKIMHKKNIEFTQGNNDIPYASALNNYGLFFYWTKKEKDSALIYFNEAYDLVNTHFPDHYLIGSIRDNIADIYVEQSRIAQANTLYKENFKFFKTLYTVLYAGIDVQRLISAARQTIQTDLALDSMDSAQITLKQLQQIVNDTANNISQYPNSKLEYFQANEMFLAASGKNHEAYEMAKIVKQLSDSILQVETALKSTRERTINDLTFERFRNQYQIEKQQKESELRNQRLKLWIISLTAFFIIVMLSSLYLRRRQNIINARNKQLIAEQDLKFTALKNEQLNSEIVSKKRDLSDFALNLSQSQEWAIELANKLNELKQTTGRARKKMFDDFEQEINNKISFDQNTKEFYNKLDELNHSFYKKLKQRFPKLTKTDTRLCSLIRLKIDNHEISTLQNISKSSLNTSRYRLRKKLKLSENEDLNDFIQSL